MGGAAGAGASSGIGTSPQLSGELFARQAGIELVHVPCRGSAPAVADLLRGQVKMMFAPASSVMQVVRSGKLRALAITSAGRNAIAPGVPTMAESGLKGFETAVWSGPVAPVGTPAPILEKLRVEAHATPDTPEVRAAFGANGIELRKSTAQEFTGYMQADSAPRWSELIHAAGIKPE